MNVKNFFLSHLLFPLVSFVLAAIMIVLNKKNAFLSNKQLIVFILISSLVIALPGLFGFLGLLFIPQLYIFNQLIFLVVGYFYMNKTSIFFSSDNETVNRLMIVLSTICVLCLGSYLFSLIFNFASEFKYGLIASTCTYTLVLPVLFRWTYLALLNIPSEIYKMWKYSATYNEPEFTSETIERIMVLELELSKSPSDTDFIKVKAKAPAAFIFGDWFQLFLNDYNSKYFEHPIQYQSTSGEVYNWIFYVKPSISSGKKYIDHEKSILNNNIDERYTIICKRVDKTY